MNWSERASFGIASDNYFEEKGREMEKCNRLILDFSGNIMWILIDTILFLRYYRDVCKSPDFALQKRDIIYLTSRQSDY